MTIGSLAAGGSYLGFSYSPLAGIAFVLVIFVGLLSLSLWRTYDELFALRLREPAIEMGAPWVNNGPAGTGVDVHDGQNLLFRASFVLIPLRNVKRPETPNGETARDVHGTITLQREDGTVLDGPRQMRWQEKPEQIVRNRPPSAADVAEIDIPPNGRAYIADAVLQDRSEFGLRIWSQDGLRHPLVQEACLAVVTIEGSNISEKSFPFWVTPGSPGSLPTVRTQGQT